MKKKIYLYSLILFLIDFIVKRIVIKYLKLNFSIKVIKNFFYLTYVRNNGAAFSILNNQKILLLLITVICLFYINNYLTKNELDKVETISFCLITGGILGNLFDRLVYGSVIDYFDFKIFSYDFAIFNLADTFIVIGVFILLIYSFIKERRIKNGDSSRRRNKRKN